MKVPLKILALIWASPNSLLGVLVGVLGMLSGGGVQFRQGCLEFYGGLIAKLLRCTPMGTFIAAMTLGHTILGINREVLDTVRAHEQVHVRQYERWGPFFLPAYLGWSLILRIQKRDPYLDNPFEVEAYAVSDPSQMDGER